jgi:hypothetical protein
MEDKRIDHFGIFFIRLLAILLNLSILFLFYSHLQEEVINLANQIKYNISGCSLQLLERETTGGSQLGGERTPLDGPWKGKVLQPV